MIPTSSKAKLPKTLSYPIGAAAISEALFGAPHSDKLCLSFEDAPLWRASTFQRILKDGLPYRIMEARYHAPYQLGYSRARILDAGHWLVHVYPVRRDLRSVAGALLRTQGLLMMVEWLRSSGQIGWLDRYHTLDLVFAPLNGTLSSRRTDGV